MEVKPEENLNALAKITGVSPLPLVLGTITKYRNLLKDMQMTDLLTTLDSMLLERKNLGQRLMEKHMKFQRSAKLERYLEDAKYAKIHS